jgi:cytochrome P450
MVWVTPPGSLEVTELATPTGGPFQPECYLGRVSLLDPAVQDDPFDYYAEIHGTCPVRHLAEVDMWLLANYDDVRASLIDTERFSSMGGASRGLGAEASKRHQQILAERGWGHVATLQRTDPPEHTRYRKLLNRVFTQRRVKEMTPRIEAIANELVDSFIDRGSCEFVSEFALPLPGIVIAEQLGLDRSQIHTFKRWADAMLAFASRPVSVEEAADVAEVELEAQHHLAAIFEARRAEPRDDLMSALVHAHGTDEEALTMAELQNLMHQLVTGGFETTTAGIAHAMWLLLRYPDQFALLRERPELLRNFIEESLRYDAPVQGLWRRTTCPVEVRGVEIPAGASVILRYGAANRDPEEFDDPNRFDITRANANNHVAFGLGAHFCIGAALARQEMLTSFEVLLARLDDLALAEALPTPAHEPNFFLRPLKGLPISFRASTR